MTSKINKHKIIDITPIVSVNRDNAMNDDGTKNYLVKYLLKFSNGFVHDISLTVNAVDEDTAIYKANQMINDGIRILLKDIDEIPNEF